MEGLNVNTEIVVAHIKKEIIERVKQAKGSKKVWKCSSLLQKICN